MGDIEIHIRRSTKATDEYKTKEINSSTPVRSSAITQQNGNQEKKGSTEDKPQLNQPDWDYSASRGKKIIVLEILFIIYIN
jgi:hypothetical protein